MVYGQLRFQVSFQFQRNYNTQNVCPSELKNAYNDIKKNYDIKERISMRQA